MTGEEPVKTQPRAAAAQFRVQQQDAPPRPSLVSTARTEPIPAFGSTVATAPAPAVQAPAASATTSVAEPLEFQMPETLEPPLEEVAEHAFSESTLAKTADVDTRILADAPVDEPPPSTQYIPPPSLVREPDVAPPPPVAPAPPAAPEPKHVKVRSSIDIMAELEALRKRATTTQPAAPKPRKEMTAADVTIPTPKPKRDVHRTVNMQLAPETASRAKSVRVTVSFENDEGIVNSEEQTIDLADASDVRSLSLDVKISLD